MLSYDHHDLHKNNPRRNQDFSYPIFFALTASIFVFFLILFEIRPLHNSRLSSPVNRIHITDIDEISFLILDESSWINMNTQQRLDALQRVANCEMDAIGIEKAQVISDDLENDGSTYVIGCYRPSVHEIVIDSRCLKQFSYAEILESLLHECRHAYQYSIVAVLNWDNSTVQHHQYFEDARRWKAEFMQEETDFHTYYFQSIECDARSYAKERLGLYLGIDSE